VTPDDDTLDAVKGVGEDPLSPTPSEPATCSTVSLPTVIEGPPARSAAQPCGTWAAYKRHKRRGDEPCEPCGEAQRARGRARYHQNRDRYLVNSRRRYDEVVLPERRRRALRQQLCPTCAGSFETTNALQTFCSAGCRQVAPTAGRTEG
jgi:hypothetical protein